MKGFLIAFKLKIRTNHVSKPNSLAANPPVTSIIAASRFPPLFTKKSKMVPPPKEILIQLLFDMYS